MDDTFLAFGLKAASLFFHFLGSVAELGCHAFTHSPIC
jgi:hypothetical protein